METISFIYSEHGFDLSVDAEFEMVHNYNMLTNEPADVEMHGIEVNDDLDIDKVAIVTITNGNTLIKTVRQAIEDQAWTEWENR